MTARRYIIVLVMLLSLAVLSTAAPSFALDLKTIFQAVTGSEPYAKVHPRDVASLLQDKSKKVEVFDANSPAVRAKEGIIRGAHLLSSSGQYDVASELPGDKTIKLIFYCHNWL